VLLHGFTGSSASWGAQLLDGLSGAGLTPVLLDLPGHGAEAGVTDPARFTLESTLRRIGEAGAWPADIIGYSMGGRIALHFAAAFPERVRRLVLESSSPGLELETERAARRAADAGLAERLLSGGIEWFVEHWEAQPLFESRARLDRSILARQRELRLQNDPASLAAALDWLGTGRLPSLWHCLHEIATPTLLLVGARDERFVAVAERMARAMPDARLVVVPGVGHSVHLEAPAAWLEAVLAFLMSASPLPGRD
jgi:2-succinyl-6-hydroxy-2,4-cyclohexadiene-1-carboxylate synthase